MKIYISPGHGAIELLETAVPDPGFVNDVFNLTEHDCCRQIVRWIMEYSIGIRDFEVISDPRMVFGIAPLEKLTLNAKIQRINLINPDLAIEVHLNCTGVPIDRTVDGTEVLFYQGSKKGMDAAFCLQKNLFRVMGSRSRKVKSRKTFVFLRDTNCPAIITEARFLSCDAVAEQLRRGFLIRQIAWAHVQGMEELNRNTSKTLEDIIGRT